MTEYSSLLFTVLLLALSSPSSSQDESSILTIMVAGGPVADGKANTADVEVVRLSFPSVPWRCDKPDPFPFEAQGPIGMLDESGTPMICGGDDPLTSQAKVGQLCEEYLNWRKYHI